ncbi:MAG: group 1 truncated hemoglobin [Lysobacterales bacterium]
MRRATFLMQVTLSPRVSLRTQLAALAMSFSMLMSGCASLSTDQATLYERLGGKEGVALIVNEFIIAMANEDAVRPHFRNINIAGFRARLEDFLCQTADGPCEYSGRSMKQAHATLGIERPAFNAIVEALMNAMEASEVSFADQNALLARLAMMESDVVSAHPFKPPARQIQP